MNIPDTNNNPGNIKDSRTGEFKKFSSVEEGYASLMNDLQNKAKGNTSTSLTPKSTLVDFTNVWAPKSDKNDPDQYAADLSNWLGVRPDITLEELGKYPKEWAQAVARKEGHSSAQGFETKLNLGDYNNGQTKPETLGGNLMQEGSHAVEGVKQLFTGHGSQGQEAGSVGQDLLNRGAGALHIAGAAGGAISDVVGAGASKLFGMLPENIRKPIEDTGSAVVHSIVSNPTVQKGIIAAQEYGKAHPDQADALSDVFNITTALIPTVKTVQAVKGLIVTGLVKKAMVNEAGAQIINTAKKEGYDVFKPIVQAMDGMGIKPNKKINPSLLRTELEAMYVNEKTRLTQIIKKETLDQAVNGNSAAEAVKKSMAEITAAVRLLPTLGIPAKEGLIKKAFKNTVKYGTTGIGASVGGPVGAMLGENLGSRIASSITPKAGLISRAMAAKSKIR